VRNRTEKFIGINFAKIRLDEPFVDKKFEAL